MSLGTQADTSTPPAPEPGMTPAGTPTHHRGPADAVLGLLARSFGADLRSLAAFRIVLGAVILFDLVGRWPDLQIHYSDAGLLSREHLLDSLNPWRWSVYLFNGTTAYAHALFALTAAVTIAVIVGYRTRVMTVAMWVLLVSLQVRNPLVLSGADSYLRVLAFWAMFLPLGAVWSIDARQARRPPASMWLASMATAALSLQIAFVYIFTALLKTGDEWRTDFTALWYTLGAEQLTTPFGAWAHQFPDLLRVLSVGALAIEAIAPVILFVPWRNALMRLVGIALIAGLQVGIMLTMNIGLFPWISAACMVWFVPAGGWDRLAIIAKTRFRRLAAIPGLRERAAAPATWLSGIGARFSFATAPGSGPPGDGMMGESPAPRLAFTSRRPVSTSLPANLAAAILLLLVLGWNIDTVSSYRMPSETRPVVYGLGLYQRWAMFAPAPPRSTQWMVVAGTLQDGRQVSLLEPLVHDDLGGALPLSWLRPAYIGGDYYGDKYWRKYFEALNEDSGTDERRLLAGYLCRHWNRQHEGESRLVTVQLYSVLEATLPEGEQAEQRRIEKSAHTCA